MKIEYDFGREWIADIFTLIKISFLKDVFCDNEICVLFCLFNFWFEITFNYERR